MAELSDKALDEDSAAKFFEMLGVRAGR